MPINMSIASPKVYTYYLHGNSEVGDRQLTFNWWCQRWPCVLLCFEQWFSSKVECPTYRKYPDGRDNKARCVSLLWVILLLNHVFSRLSVENEFSEEATDTGSERQSSMNFSTSFSNSLVWGCSPLKNCALSVDVRSPLSLVRLPNSVSCICKQDLSIWIGRWGEMSSKPQ